ncbi:MAG: hypothetical protein JWQ26_3973 [Modestobacter sp.]|nr:hypothetical protein [Modestobacter sp.]
MRQRVNAAIDFLAFLDDHRRDLAGADQALLDLYLASGSRRTVVRDFLAWARQQGRCQPLTDPLRPTLSPASALHQDERWAVLRRLLHDNDIKVHLRIAGVLNLLYGQHLSRIVALTTDQIGRDRNATFTSPSVRPAAGCSNPSASFSSTSSDETGGRLWSPASPRRRARCSPAVRRGDTSPLKGSARSRQPSVARHVVGATQPWPSWLRTSQPRCWPRCSACTPTSVRVSNVATGTSPAAGQARRPRAGGRRRWRDGLPAIDLGAFADALVALDADRAAWAAYEEARPAPDGDDRYDAWEAAGPQRHPMARVLGVMSRTEVARLRLLAVFSSQRVPLGVWDTQGLDDAGQELLFDWCRALLTA